MTNFVKYWFETARNGQNFWFQMDMHGGKNSAVTKVATDGTAYAHRDKLFLFQLYNPSFGSFSASGFDFLTKWASTTVEPLASSDWGMYINYADSQLTKAQAQQNYYGANLKRLQKLKAAVDPKDLFYSPLSIQPVA